MKFELYLLRNNIHTVFPRGSLLAAPPLTDSPAAITEVWSEFLPRLRASEEPVRDRGDNCLFPGQGGGSENRGARGSNSENKRFHLSWTFYPTKDLWSRGARGDSGEKLLDVVQDVAGWGVLLRLTRCGDSGRPAGLPAPKPAIVSGWDDEEV